MRLRSGALARRFTLGTLPPAPLSPGGKRLVTEAGQRGELRPTQAAALKLIEQLLPPFRGRTHPPPGVGLNNVRLVLSNIFHTRLCYGKNAPAG